MAVDCHIHMALDGGYWKDALARHKDAPEAATAGTPESTPASWRENTA